MFDRLTPAKLKDLLQRDHTLHGAVLFGLDGYAVELQARAVEVKRSPIPWRKSTSITGMASGVVYQALDRIAGAFAKLRIPEPQVEILINLAPPDVEKEGTWLDLPLAIIMLQAAGYLPDLPESQERQMLLVGELGLHADVRRVPGVLSIAFMAKPGQMLIVPDGNEKECALILAKPGHEGCKVFVAQRLDQVIDFFRGQGSLENALRQGIEFEPVIPPCIDFGKIKGQTKAKQAALISAAGGHNLLLIGPPGEGKSLLASAIPGILPRLTNDEKVELTRIYSASGKLERDGVAITRRPMRSVHNSATKQSILGGGAGVPRPGEITLAHLGVLFLDELAEFSQTTIDSLRQPIESGFVDVSRVRASLRFPCQFTLVAAMNPCPCGYYPGENCKCKGSDVKRYLQKISGPILDRIDLQVELKPLTTDERFADESADESRKLRARVQDARNMQIERFRQAGIPFNAAIPGGCIREYCDFSNEGFEAYKSLIDASRLTTRSTDRIAKVSRTIADLSASRQIEKPHVEEAGAFVVGGLLREQFA